MSGIREKSEWKSIPINVDFSGKRDLICFEELTDYEVVTYDKDAEDEVPATAPSKKEQKRQKRLLEYQAKMRLLDGDDGASPGEKDQIPTKRRKMDQNNNKTNNGPSKTETKKTTVTKKRKPKQKLSAPVIDVPAPDDNCEDVGQQKAEEVDMSAWASLMIPEQVSKALAGMNFTHPTQIQSEVIGKAIQARLDVVAAAETGSGKTLAFGIPLLHHMMEDRERGIDLKLESEDLELLEDEMEDEEDVVSFDIPEENNSISSTKQLPALILTPTRELAMQVKDHVAKAGKYAGFKIVAIVGGMSVQKQERLLNAGPDIIIATPGRLWEFINQGHPYLASLHLIRYLVIDEADRMLEKGHFEELVKILDVMNNKKYRNAKRQTYIFSATLTTTHHAPDRIRGKSVTKSVKLETLMKKVGIKAERHVVDLTTKKGTAENLYEAKIVCAVPEKDLYVFYFIKSHPGRTLIFTNSIDCIFHLSGVLQALCLQPLNLHAKMQQRQRLKHLEKFRADPNSVLIASDVAARGLDIPNVQHVIHYQVPRTCETYIHRSGRSARTGKEGLSLLLVSPDEMMFYKRLCSSLKLEAGIAQFDVDEQRLAAVRKVVRIAKEIDALSHRRKKVRLNNDWFTKAAAEMDIELDEDVLQKDEDMEESEREVKQKKKQLKQLLNQPLFTKSCQGKYPTKTGKLNLPVTRTQDSAIERVKRSVTR